MRKGEFTEGQVLLAFVAAIAGCLVLGAYLGRGAHYPHRSLEGQGQ